MHGEEDVLVHGEEEDVLVHEEEEDVLVHGEEEDVCVGSVVREWRLVIGVGCRR